MRVETEVGGYSYSIHFNHDPLHLKHDLYFSEDFSTPGTLLFLPADLSTDAFVPRPYAKAVYQQPIP